MSDETEIERLTAGLPPARAEDSEVNRVLEGRPPAPAPAGDNVAALSAVSAPLARVTSGWEPSTLEGPRRIRIGKAEFWIPRTAQTKSSRRAGTTWVKLASGEVFILSELGQLVQTTAERKAARWDLL